jgi:hypothetical protein
MRFDGLFGGTKTYRPDVVMRFLDEVAKSSIQSLILHDYPCNLVDLLVDCWSCTKPDHLRKFELGIDGYLSNIPRNIASLAFLTHFHIKVYEVEAECLHSLGKLPNQVLLNLVVESAPPKRCFIPRDCFQGLKIFSYNYFYHGMGLQFDPGAMPQLQSLQISFGPMQTKSTCRNFSFDIQFLSRLARVRATMNCARATAFEMGAADAAIRQQVSLIPNSPLPQLSREEVAMGKGKHSHNLPIGSNVESVKPIMTKK